jgi:HD superfamily phosphodiesterase
MPHYARVYETAQQLSAAEGREFDDDVLLASAYLHDIGAFEPYREEGVDHADQSAEVCGEILQGMGFPAEKVPQVEVAIRGHMYYAKPTADWEAILLHDADVLDFLGAVGIMRIISITGTHRWAPDLPGAIKTLQNFLEQLPGSIITSAAQELGKERKIEMEQFFRALAGETVNLTAL